MEFLLGMGLGAGLYLISALVADWLRTRTEKAWWERQQKPMDFPDSDKGGRHE